MVWKTSSGWSTHQPAGRVTYHRRTASVTATTAHGVHTGNSSHSPGGRVSVICSLELSPLWSVDAPSGSRMRARRRPVFFLIRCARSVPTTVSFPQTTTHSLAEITWKLSQTLNKSSSCLHLRVQYCLRGPPSAFNLSATDVLFFSEVQHLQPKSMSCTRYQIAYIAFKLVLSAQFV